MSICFGVQTWDDVDFLAVGQPVKKNFSNGLWSQKRTSYFSFYVIKRFTQIFVKLRLNMEKNAELAFFRKMIKSYFFPNFQSVHVNWHECNDNCNKVSK